MRKKNDEKKYKLTEMSDAEFLSFLYAEKDREEGLATYQGWNLWAITGAMITVIYTLYGILCKHYTEIDILNVGYILSGMLSFLFCYCPLISFAKVFFERKRGVDINKLRFLDEITPKVYLRSVLCCSLVFTVYFILADDINPWNEVTISWIITALLFVFGNVSAYRNRNNIVSSVFDVLLFTRFQWNVYFVSAVCGALSVVWVGSFRRGYGGVFNSPDLEVAICITACLLLLHLFFYINSELNTSSNINKILDDYLYKGESKENAYYQMQINRMGRGILASCGKEMMEIKKSYDDFDSYKEKLVELIRKFDKEDINAEHINQYFHWLKQTTIYAEKCCYRAKDMDSRLKQIAVQVPTLIDDEEYKKLLFIVDVLLDRTKEMMEIAHTASNKMNTWLDNNVCEKYGGVCIKECPHRHEKPLLSLRLKMILFRLIIFMFGIIRRDIKILNCSEKLGIGTDEV